MIRLEYQILPNLKVWTPMLNANGSDYFGQDYKEKII